MAAIIGVAFLLFGRPVRGFFGTADLVALMAVGAVGLVLAVTLITIVVMTTRRRRAASGGCVTCRFQCQHAMTGSPGRSLPGGRTLLPIQPVTPQPVRNNDFDCRERVPAGAGPRWPDRPMHHLNWARSKDSLAERSVAALPGHEPRRAGAGLPGQHLAAVRELGGQGGGLVKAFGVEDRRDPQIAPQGQFQAAGHRVPGDRRDHRLGQPQPAHAHRRSTVVTGPDRSTLTA
jgi:hypothetical protein